MMTTSFVRITVVLSLLRQALGGQQLPPNQVLTSIALFMTFLIMSPVWTKVYQDAVVPYTEQKCSLEEAWKTGVAPVRQFIKRQIEQDGQQRRRVAVLQIPAGDINAASQLRRRASASTVAGLRAQRAQDGVS